MKSSKNLWVMQMILYKQPSLVFVFRALHAQLKYEKASNRGRYKQENIRNLHEESQTTKGSSCKPKTTYPPNP